MLPSVAADELRTAVQAFLRNAYPIATRYFQGNELEPAPHALVDDLLERPEEVFKGPYLDIKLPFRLAKEGELPFQHLKLPFTTPYQHQQRAFQRLTGEAPKSTLIATGTGSGKTECFMLPALEDSCTRREKGIKTIVVYPMNALGTDQARRFAKEVRKLDTKLTVGLFVGMGGGAGDEAMGPENVITDHNTLRQYPPDILLTNYKMLDFLLIRPQDQPVWRFNEPGRLRYLVVDELHTFDGAQGTDLACLVRRLRDRLEAGPELACIGTSATLGTEAGGSLLEYAREVFAAEFDEQSTVVEDRLSPSEYLLGHTPEEQTKRREAIEYFSRPNGDERELDPANYDQADDYLFYQVRLWFTDLEASQVPPLNAPSQWRRAEGAVQLGELLHKHEQFHSLISELDTLRSVGELAEKWRFRYGLQSEQQAWQLVMSLSSLISAARVWNQPDSDDPDDWCAPLLQVRQQLWLRELRRMVSKVPLNADENPELRFADDLRDQEAPLHLPLLHCRECNMAAWGIVQKSGELHCDGNLQTFYQQWFSYSRQAALLVPLAEGDEPGEPVRHFCPACQRLSPANGDAVCSDCPDQPLLRVWVPDLLKQVQRQGQDTTVATHDCPECGATESLQILGYRAATLTSVMSGRLFSTPYNDDHKLIAFSDSVQDAAHRAGFLGANTWREVIRQAMTRWLREQPMAPSLQEMKEWFPRGWRDWIGRDDRFCGLFIAPNMQWLADYQRLTEENRLPQNSDLSDLVMKRMSWECLAEFGRRGQFGRSLERMGVGGVALDQNALRKDLDGILDRLREEIEALRDLDADTFLTFLTGWLHHLRRLGAIHDPMLETYFNYKGKEYLLNKLNWMPGFGRAQRPPAALTLQHVSNNFEAVVRNRGETWSLQWLKKTLGSESLFAGAEARQIFSIILKGLTDKQWLVERDAQGQSLWLLNPEKLQVSRTVASFRCSDCRHRIVVAEHGAAAYEGMPCMRLKCRGHLEPEKALPAHTMRAPEQPRRLVPHEHTGLLEHDQRLRVEDSFMNGQEPWHINLLSATPTLEMGIDIGDLSTVMLCSVPPTQANYLQRIGRAGRRDGNALAVTVAGGQNHDLYFYGDPLEMISGAVDPPGVFLNAIAVLERQMMAFCFDRWAASGIDPSAIPGEMRRVLDAVEYGHKDKFPYNLLDFIAGHRQSLISGFFQRFDHLSDEARQYLEWHLSGEGEGSMALRLTEALQRLVDDRKKWLKKADKLRYEKERLEKQPTDEVVEENIREVEQERNAILSLVYRQNKRHVFAFLTDEGLLPNYAFPEEGVTLRSVVLKRLSTEQQESQEKKYERISYEFQRPAQAALSELAPQSQFYAINHKMEVDQVDLEGVRPQEWRFCSVCHYNERVDTGDKHSACPSCGSAQWADRGQKRDVLKLRQVYATVDDKHNRIGDDTEQREPQFFNRQMLATIPQEGHKGGFRIADETLPFGFEYLQKAVFREINFGEPGDESHAFTVAGQELSRRGFRICRNCGKVQKERWRKNEQPHAWTCKLRRNPEKESEEEYFDSLYLYRELNSEAIRILLPLSEVAYSDENLHSFIAALNLGLRDYFSGDVHHLEITEMREPSSSDSAERIYLVIYDRIPGGTGYLKELMREPDVMKAVLAGARDHLAHCGCNDDQHRDGCYRCILAYRNSRHMGTISRDAAKALLSDILTRWDQLTPIETLSDISTNALVESKLEQRFVDALGQIRDARLTPALVNGKHGHTLTLPGPDGRPMAWNLEHQVNVGPADGVPVQTRVDVLLKPARAEDAARIRPIAVYADGLQYHQDIVDDDVLKRMALVRSGRYWVWTLNWDDLPEHGKPPEGHQRDPMRVETPIHDTMQQTFDQLANAQGWESAAEHRARHEKGSFCWLERVLRDPETTTGYLYQRATWRAFTLLNPKLARDERVANGLSEVALRTAPESLRDDIDPTRSALIPGGLAEPLGVTLQGMTGLAALQQSVLKDSNAETVAQSIRCHLCFDDETDWPADEFKAQWRGFWHSVNQLQFLPGFSFASLKAVSSGKLNTVMEAPVPTADAEPDYESKEDDWAEVYELSLLTREQLDAMKGLGLPEPEVGLDITDASGAVVMGGDALDCVWPQARVAIVVEPITGAVEGWTIIPDDERMVEHLRELRENGVF
ncbi:DEAD/DEAH box helicase [Spiribacter roseus]|uniref:DEAD/DEAH box helicase n=1 Tax=Spiribacter roseus TaxID=1855875 RepID=UPI001330D42B|nr:DEAD/DEAH box helicase [Spiribacter roseus]KAF0282828.1 hypothetical protein BA898_06010 [Spiribacter roseus]